MYECVYMGVCTCKRMVCGRIYAFLAAHHITYLTYPTPQHNTHPYLHHVPHHPVCLTPPQHTHLPPKIAGRAFDEAKTEALLMTGAPGGPVWEEEGQGTDGWDWFTMLGIERPKVCICVHMCGIILIN